MCQLSETKNLSLANISNIENIKALSDLPITVLLILVIAGMLFYAIRLLKVTLQMLVKSNLMVSQSILHLESMIMDTHTLMSGIECQADNKIHNQAITNIDHWNSQQKRILFLLGEEISKK